MSGVYYKYCDCTNRVDVEKAKGKVILYDALGSPCINPFLLMPLLIDLYHLDPQTFLSRCAIS